MKMTKADDNRKHFFKDSFIVEFWNRTFWCLEQISVFNVITIASKKMFTKEISTFFVECWVLFNLLFALFVSVILSRLGNFDYYYLLLLYGMLRVFEIITYQINMLLFHPYRKMKAGGKYTYKSPTRTVILLFHNYFEMIFWYCAIYVAISNASNPGNSLSFFHYIKMSMLCFSTFDTTLVLGNDVLKTISQVAFTELIAGVIMTVISLARFIGLLPEHKSDEEL